MWCWAKSLILLWVFVSFLDVCCLCVMLYFIHGHKILSQYHINLFQKIFFLTTFAYNNKKEKKEKKKKERKQVILSLIFFNIKKYDSCNRLHIETCQNGLKQAGTTCIDWEGQRIWVTSYTGIIYKSSMCCFCYWWPVQNLTTIDPNSSKNIIFGDLCTYLASYFYWFLFIIFVQNIVQVEYYYYVG